MLAPRTPRAGPGRGVRRTNVRVCNNAPNYGIYMLGTSSLNLVSSRIEQNSGGIYMQSSTTATILNSTISGNTSDGSGGGISNAGTLTIVNSTISGNSALTHGGGILNTGTTSLYNVTIASNTADAVPIARSANRHTDNHACFGFATPLLAISVDRAELKEPRQCTI